MAEWLYTLRGRFTPELNDGWANYVALSGFVQAREIVTLDSMLCPDLIDEIVDEDWRYNVHADYQTTLFRELDCLLRRRPTDWSRCQALAILPRPDGSESVPAGFVECGFDIVDEFFGHSTLTNCGPLPDAFDPAEVNEFGLLADCIRANAVRNRMRRIEPHDPHLGRCEVWRVARAVVRG